MQFMARFVPSTTRDSDIPNSGPHPSVFRARAAFLGYGREPRRAAVGPHRPSLRWTRWFLDMALCSMRSVKSRMVLSAGSFSDIRGPTKSDGGGEGGADGPKSAWRQGKRRAHPSGQPRVAIPCRLRWEASWPGKMRPRAAGLTSETRSATVSASCGARGAGLARGPQAPGLRGENLSHANRRWRVECPIPLAPRSRSTASHTRESRVRVVCSGWDGLRSAPGVCQWRVLERCAACWTISCAERLPRV
jgi:hypothetical protein